MSAPPLSPPPPPPPRAPDSSRLLFAALATVAYVAVVITAFGFLSLFLGRDVIAEVDAGTLLGPSMVAAAAVVTFFALLRVRDRRAPWGTALAAAASTYWVVILVAGIGYAWGRGDLVWVVVYAARQAISPFVVAAALLAGVVVVSLWAVSPHPSASGRGIDRQGPPG